MMSKNIVKLATAAAILAAVGTAVYAQDKYSLKSPSGIAFSDFRGYEDWAVVSSARTDEVLKVIVANPTMMPDRPTQAFLIEKDSKRFPKSGGWGYALFNHDAASGSMTADAEAKADCGHSCHMAVKSKDYIFHPYQKR